MSSLIPIDVTLKSLTVTGTEVSLTATALSEEGMATFLRNLKDSPRFEKLSLVYVSSGSEKELGIEFELAAEYLLVRSED
jgi:Tfp pilus assembly protein PilN